MVDLNDLVVFSRVVRDGGFTAAAKSLGLPRSNVSRRVARLEAALGARLLERTTRRLHLTEAGDLYLRHCRRIEEEVESAEVSLHHLLEAPRGQLRVTASVTTGQHLLAPHLADFMVRYPEVKLDLALTNRRLDLVEEGFDVALRVGKLPSSSLVARFVGPMRSFVYASPDYLARHGEPRCPDDIGKHRCLTMSDSPAHQTWDLANSGCLARRVEITASGSMNDLETLRQAVRGGAGLAVLPAYICTGDAAAGSLRRALPDWGPKPGDCHLIYPSRRGATPKLKAFVDLMAARIGAQLAE